MHNPHSSIKRLLLAGGLSLGVLATAALSASTAGAQSAPGFVGIIPQISAVQVTALGTEATLSFITTQPAAVTIDYKPATGLGAGGQSPAQGYATAHEHERKLTGLTSNTTYDVTVIAQTQSGQKHTAQTRFTTARQRVRITLREINITDDGDWIGDGEPAWYLRLKWAGGSNGACFPIDCQVGSYGEGRIFPRNLQGQFLSWTFAEENFDTMPAAFTIDAAGDESDGPLSEVLQDCAFVGPEDVFCDIEELRFSTAAWQGPAGRDFASTPVLVNANNGARGFTSTMTFTFELFHDNLSYPSARNMPQSTWHR